MNSYSVAIMFLKSIGGEASEADTTRLASIIDEFTKSGFRSGLEECKKIYQDLHPGQCKMFSEGFDCKCFLCRADNKKMDV